MAGCGHLRCGRGTGMRVKTLLGDGLPQVLPGHRTIAMYRGMSQFNRTCRGAPRRVYKRSAALRGHSDTVGAYVSDPGR